MSDPVSAAAPSVTSPERRRMLTSATGPLTKCHQHHPLEYSRSTRGVPLLRHVVSDACEILQAEHGSWQNLNHLVVCRRTGSCVIIDPFDGHFWDRVVVDQGFDLRGIWLTHTHWDHVCGVDVLHEKRPELPVRFHINEKERGWDGDVTHAWNHDLGHPVVERVGNLEISVHVTPGHTPGHLTFTGSGFIVSGDCLFLGRCGRTDLFGGNSGAMWNSIQYLKDIFKSCDEETLVFPGHRYEINTGETPTASPIREVLKRNPVFLAKDRAEFDTLSFLSFDDDLATQARRRLAKMNAQSKESSSNESIELGS